MSPLKSEDALDDLETDIVTLEADLLTAQRAAGDMVGDELATGIAEAEATILKLRLDMRYRIYFRLARKARRKKCPIHPPTALVVSCPECCEAWGYAPPVAESGLVVDLRATAAAVEEGMAHDVAPKTTLRILEASRRTG